MFHVGQHVVCINTISEISIKRAEQRHGIRLKAPECNRVYTVRGTFTQRDKLFLYLEEIVNPINRAGREPSLNSRNFRPLKKLSVNDFTTTKEPVES